MWLVPQACSTTYRPLWTSPFESGLVLPCSSVIMAANLSVSLLMAAARSNMYLCLAGPIKEVSTHERNSRPGFECFLGGGNNFLEFLGSGLRSLTNKFLSDWVFDIIMFGWFGFSELSIEEVAIHSSEAVSLELSECQHWDCFVVYINKIQQSRI